jgi:hypothetical protein
MQPVGPLTRGYLEGGTGRYYHRFFEGHLGVPVSASERLILHGGYDGTEADPNDDVADARIRLESTQETIQLNAQLHGAVQRYDLYGASADPTVRPAPPATPARDGFAAGGLMELRSTTSVPAHATLSYDHAEYTSSLAAGGSERTFSQRQFTLEGAATLPLPFRPRLRAEYRRSWLGTDPSDATAYDVDASATLSVYDSDRLSADVGGSVLAFETPARPATPQPDTLTASATFIVPRVDVEWALGDRSTLHLRNQPRLGSTSLDDLYATNPYAQHAPSLRPPLETTNAEVGLTWSRGSVRLTTGVGYRYAPTYRYFELGGQAAYTDGLYQVQYESARIFQGRAEAALQGVDGVQASLGFAVRDGALSLADTSDIDIPNFATLTADAMVGVSFADGDGLVTAETRLKGPRYASTAQTTRLDPYFTLDLEAAYAVAANIEIVARAQNLSPQTPTLWARYPRPPAEVSAGLRLKW